MKKLIISTLILAGFIAYFAWPEKVISHPYGILAPDEPLQIAVKNPQIWQVDEYTYKPLAEFKLKARVLSKNNFWVGKESKISPVDLALGWGRMSDESALQYIEISQANRWYKWECDFFPMPAKEISTHSANMHIIPASEEVEDKLDDIFKGSIVELKGYLVEVRSSEGWFWKSSLSRTDTGGGACEVFWVDELNVFN